MHLTSHATFHGDKIVNQVQTTPRMTNFRQVGEDWYEPQFLLLLLPMHTVIFTRRMADGSSKRLA